MTMDRRAMLGGLCAAALWAGRPAQAVGPVEAPVSTDEQWFDARRRRELPLRLRLPAGDGAVPLVLFSHGLGGDLGAGTAWAEAWQAAGLAVLHLQHPGSDSAIWRGGAAAVRRAASAEQLIARCEDVRFVLDELARRQAAGGAPWRRLRLDAVGMSGHSFGAHTTLAVAGRRYPGAVELGDARPRAFAAFSPSPGSSRTGAPATGLDAITRPMLCLTGSLDGDPLGDERGGTWRRAVFDALPAGHKAELWLEGADHISFGGQSSRRLNRRRAPITLERAPAHQALIEAVSSAWWRAELLGDEAARRWLGQPSGLQAGDAWRQG